MSGPYTIYHLTAGEPDPTIVDTVPALDAAFDIFVELVRNDVYSATIVNAQRVPIASFTRDWR